MYVYFSASNINLHHNIGQIRFINQYLFNQDNSVPTSMIIQICNVQLLCLQIATANKAVVYRFINIIGRPC